MGQMLVHARNGSAPRGGRTTEQTAYASHHVAQACPMCRSLSFCFQFCPKAWSVLLFCINNNRIPPHMTLSYFYTSYLEDLLQRIQPEQEERQLKDLFATRNLLDMQGHPEDVHEIMKLITSRDFFGSEAGFNVKMRAKLVSLLLGHMRQARAAQVDSCKGTLQICFKESLQGFCYTLIVIPMTDII